MAPKKKNSKIDELKVIQDLSTLFSSTSDLKDTLQETIHLIIHLTKADACFLYLYDSQKKNLVLAASKTPHPDEVGTLRLEMGEGITGWVAQHHKPVAIAKDAQKDKRFLGALPEDKFEAFISIPILIKAKVIGVINAQHKKPYKATSRLLGLLATIGRQVGGAIETARLYEETQRRAKAIEALTLVSHTLTQDQVQGDMMQMIINRTAHMMGTNACSIMLLDEKKNELRIVAAYALDPEYIHKPPVKASGTISGKAIKSKQPVVVSDVRQEDSFQYKELAQKQGLVSMLAVPMIYKNKVLGILNSYKSESESFSKDEIVFVQTVANQCAAAMENTRLLSEKLAAQESLESRKKIERAKGLLMSTKNLTEQDAFREIQRQSMDRRKSMREISEAIILAHELVG